MSFCDTAGINPQQLHGFYLKFALGKFRRGMVSENESGPGGERGVAGGVCARIACWRDAPPTTRLLSSARPCLVPFDDESCCSALLVNIEHRKWKTLRILRGMCCILIVRGIDGFSICNGYCCQSLHLSFSSNFSVSGSAGWT